MNSVLSLVQPVLIWWQSARPLVRLLVGASLVAIIGLMGLTPNGLFGITLAWPYAALIAAVGWGKSGFAFSPIGLLILFGFAQDVSVSAPLGAFALINVLAFGAAALLYQVFDSERSPGIFFGLPMALIVLAIVVVWIMASLVSGHLERVEPLTAALISTLLLQGLIAPVFDLGVQQERHVGGNL